MRIAYVEDNATNQALVERVARMTQHVIVPYAEGEIALHALQTEPFDLIMMDIELAGKVNGLDVVRGLRSAGFKTPIIAVTAYAMLGDRDRCLEAGCNDYLPKPIPIKDLLDLLGRYDAALKAPAAAPAETPVETPEASVPITPPVEPEPVSTPAPVAVPVTSPVVAEAVTAAPEAQPEAESKPSVTAAAASEAPPAPAVVAAPAIPVTPPVTSDSPALEAPSSVAAPAPESATAPASVSTPETPTPVIVTPPLPQTEASAPPTDEGASVAEGSEPAATPA